MGQRGGAASRGIGEDMAGLRGTGCRPSQHPVKSDGGLIVDDRLEEEGSIRLYEYTGGILYIPDVLPGQEGAVPVAGAEIIQNGAGGLKVKRMFHEYGHGGLVQIIVGQILYFADFYGYAGVESLDLKKDGRKPYSA